MKLLIANRGEIAVRIIRTCQELGISAVGVYTDVDQVALHVRHADEAIRLGNPRNYLNPQAILEAAKKCGADAIHPGYGFLSENAAFAREVEEAGILFIGPRHETIRLAGDKIAARQLAQQCGVPILVGSDGPLPRELPARLGSQVNFPILVKASAGGGGRGIRLANDADELPLMIELARKEAMNAFGSDEVYLEELVHPARHIEVQILGDGRGHILCLGERECSIQRRRQKLIEEAPAHALRANLRTSMIEAAKTIAERMNYRSLGTVEFLVDQHDNYHFIEINPRIQVEHPVTEMVTGMDLVREQILLALDGGVQLSQDMVQPMGAALEVRILAEDPQNGFIPSTGQITSFHEPGGPGVRIDSEIFQGLKVTSDYDSLLAKLIVWAEDRTAAIHRLRRALREYQINGISTDIPFLRQIVDHPQFIDGRINTSYLEDFQPQTVDPEPELLKELALATALYVHRQQKNTRSEGYEPENRWQAATWREQMERRG